MPLTAERTITVDASAGNAGTVSSWIPLDIYETPFNVGFGVVKDGDGDVTFQIQHTFDNVFDPDVSADSFIHADLTSQSTGANPFKVDGNYAFGVRAIRLAVISASGSSRLMLKVVQVGSPGN